MFWLARLMRLLRPMPPTPTPAMFNRSLGAVNPRPRTFLGTMASPAPLAIVATNLRLDTPAGAGASFCLVLLRAVIVSPPSFLEVRFFASSCLRGELDADFTTKTRRHKQSLAALL